MEFGDLFSFDKRIVPAIIKPIYWIGLFFIPIVGVIYFLSGFWKLFTTGFFTGVWDMSASVVLSVVGVLGLRILAEICLVLFEVHEKVNPVAPPPT